jgi:hypothetical protein
MAKVSSTAPMREPTFQERAGVLALRAKLSKGPDAQASAALSDADLLRFLRARQLHLPSAETMFSVHLKWQARVRPSAIEQETARGVLSDGVVRLLDMGTGIPAMWFQAGLWQPSAYSAHVFVTAIIYFVERALRCGEQFVAIFDLSGWRVGFTMHIPKIHGMITTLQDHYPERLHAALVLRARAVFHVAWKLIRTVIDPVTAKKVLFAPVEPAAAERALVNRFVDDDRLPKRLGGLSADEIPVPNIPGEPNLPARAQSAPP